jgi:two-component system sensor histidine kinase RstB
MDLASTASDDAQRNRRLEAIDHAVEDLDDLVEELVSYVQMENVSDADRRELLSVPEVLDSLIERHRSLYPEMDFCWVSSSCRESISGEPISIMADRAAFHRAIGNLIGNAARFAQSRVEVKVSPSLRAVCIDIEDDGPGIPESEHKRVLEPFVRLENQPEERSSKTGAGVGLGLAIVKRTVEQHAGSLDIGVSAQGGCRVRTYWPTEAT